MIRQWEEFPYGPNDENKNLHVTLNKKGEIMIGANAYEQMGEPEFAVLLFDNVNTLIGVQPTNRHADNRYPLKAKHRGRHRVLRANRFCRHHGIKVDRTVAFNTAEIDEGLLVLDLRKTTGIGKVKTPRNGDQ